MFDMNATPQFMREQINDATAPCAVCGATSRTLCGATSHMLCRNSAVLFFYNATHTTSVSEPTLVALCTHVIFYSNDHLCSTHAARDCLTHTVRKQLYSFFLQCNPHGGV